MRSSDASAQSGRHPTRHHSLRQSTYETTIRSRNTDFRTIGHSWGILRNFAEVPLFIDSKASRLIQLADLIAYAIFRNYERQDDSLFSIIRHSFDAEGGITHGLHAARLNATIIERCAIVSLILSYITKGAAQSNDSCEFSKMLVSAVSPAARTLATVIYAKPSSAPSAV